MEIWIKKEKTQKVTGNRRWILSLCFVRSHFYTHRSTHSKRNYKHTISFFSVNIKTFTVACHYLFFFYSPPSLLSLTQLVFCQRNLKPARQIPPVSDLHLRSQVNSCWTRDCIAKAWLAIENNQNKYIPTLLELLYFLMLFQRVLLWHVLHELFRWSNRSFSTCYLSYKLFVNSVTAKNSIIEISNCLR